MRRMFVAGNWKMHGTRASVEALLAAIKTAKHDNMDIAVFPPAIFLPYTEQVLAQSHIKWGGQNICTEASGAYTGEVSAAMLKEFGCRYVLVGHSERRSLYHETDEIVAKKFKQAKDNGLTPVLCVGESLTQREQGETLTIIKQQLSVILALEPNANALMNAIIAYEPVWAIGTGKTASAEQAQEVHAAIRSLIAEHNPSIADNIQIVYGGSVKASNAKALFAMSDIDGGLIGGASLDKDEFLAICHS